MASWRSFVFDFQFSVLSLKYKHSSSVVELFDVRRFGNKFVLSRFYSDFAEFYSQIFI